MEPEDKKVGLALGSGWTKGFMHIGVIKVLEDQGVPIDLMVGTSAGAVIGGVYSFYGNIEEAEKALIDFEWRRVPLRFFTGRSIDLFFNEHLEDATFDDLKIPFGVVAFDLKGFEPVIIKEGSVGKAIDASSAIPYFYRKVNIGGRDLIDGGFCSPLPTDETRELGADIVIGVNLRGSVGDKIRIGPGGAKLYSDVFLKNLSKEKEKNSDVVIRSELQEDFSWWDWRKPKEVIKKLIKEGEEAAKDKIDEIKEIL